MKNLLKTIPNAVFVFGSNLSGIHGAGAAQTAMVDWGAQWGEGKGRTGDAYALPTQTEGIKATRTPREIRHSLEDLVDYAKGKPDTIFIMTPVGCGLAGLNEADVLDLLRAAGGPTRNMIFTASWIDGRVY